MIPAEDIEAVGIRGKPHRELDHPQARLTRKLFDLWLAKKGDSPMPSRQEFSPAEMKDLLPFIYMIDVLEGGADFQIRLWGTALTDLIGKDYTGAKLSDETESSGWRGQIYRLTYERAAPVFYRFNLGGENQSGLVTENALLPVTDKNGDFTILLCVSQIVDRISAAD